MSPARPPGGPRTAVRQLGGLSADAPARRRASRWLQRELEWRLMLPVIAIVVATGLIGAYGARLLVERTFDRWLLDAARSLAQQVEYDGEGGARVHLTAQARALLVYDAADQVYFEVRQGERHLLGEVQMPTDGERRVRYPEGLAYDAALGPDRLRVVRVPVTGSRLGPPAEVLLGETLIKRSRAHRDLLLTMTPLGLPVLLAALAIGFAVRRTIRPLARIAERWNERSHESLQPIPADDVPRELAPFAGALNDLLERLRGLLQREREFAANAAHQLRTPLTGLQLGLARAMDAPDLASARAVLNEMSRTTQRASRLVQQLLILGRLDPEVQAEPREAQDLVSLVREVGEDLVDIALDRGVDLAFLPEVDELAVPMHPELLAEAVGNLIDNALRYTPRGGRVEVLVARRGGEAVIEVRDSGPGLPAQEHERVFERFVRGQAAAGEGTGLGLAIVREIATLHGARVTLGTSALGGLSASLHLPRASHA